MFLIMFFSCDVEVPTLTFENEGKGELWQGGTMIAIETEIDDDPDQENTNTVNPNDTGVVSDSGIIDVQDTGE